ncbi:DUF3987 domain-containing protein [Rhodoferax sp. AJA081-3]|uniref:DUF3987 domain-containing protein n=1 Tax=Rhodoferax sp. AJA081-3 TaxID=2752316 RepID=UPI001ADFC591|nr:DUF3987 domain-containing protein [Rhodoferax sp. AJA081-3]QTN27472.1 DUF3987 domain-containing protein [Rhodoferax sp. AJA081-3]
MEHGVTSRSALPDNPAAEWEAWEADDGGPLSTHRNAPQPELSCLHGVFGDVARAGSDGSETNAYAIAANLMSYLSCAIGRGPYLPVGNTWHHTRMFLLHVGRSGRGRKGDAVSLVIRLDHALRELNAAFAPQVHRGGLSSREGLVALMHDGYRQGRLEVPSIADKRLWVVESEFANVLHQSRRDGNTLSAALRDCWDGVSLKPATKNNRLYATDPHVCLSGAISPIELLSLVQHRELTNGFANRFLIIWAERSQVVPFPRETPQAIVTALAQRLLDILQFVHANWHDTMDRLRVELSPKAQWRYAQLYRGELNEDSGSPLVAALLERRAPMLLRIALLFALADLQLCIDVPHIEAAMAWVRYTTASVKYIFTSAAENERTAQVIETAQRILTFLQERGAGSRRDITVDCFKRHVSKARIDEALEHLLGSSPPKIQVQLVSRPRECPGTPTKIYCLT